MPWIKSYSELAKHHKTYKLAELLSVRIPYVIGTLHLLWWFTLEQAWRDGDLKLYTNDAIATACNWDKDPNILIDALQKSGFLDGTKVHDWLDFSGRLVTDRIRYEKANRTRTEPVRNTLRKTSSLRSQDKIREDKIREEKNKNPQKGESDPPRLQPDQILELWNQIAHKNLGRVKFLNSKREKDLRTRIRNMETINEWRELFMRVNQSPFLTGKLKDWRCTFDWVINSTNLTKILEGNYDDKNGSRSSERNFGQQVSRDHGGEVGSLPSVFMGLDKTPPKI